MSLVSSTGACGFVIYKLWRAVRRTNRGQFFIYSQASPEPIYIYIYVYLSVYSYLVFLLFSSSSSTRRLGSFITTTPTITTTTTTTTTTTHVWYFILLITYIYIYIDTHIYSSSSSTRRPSNFWFHYGFATYLDMGFETLDFKFCELKLWELTISQPLAALATMDDSLKCANRFDTYPLPRKVKEFGALVLAATMNMRQVCSILVAATAKKVIHREFSGAPC